MKRQWADGGGDDIIIICSYWFDVNMICKVLFKMHISQRAADNTDPLHEHAAFKMHQAVCHQLQRVM